MTVLKLNPFVKTHSSYVDLDSFYHSLQIIEDSYNLSIDQTTNLPESEFMSEDIEKETSTLLLRGLFYFVSAVDYCKQMRVLSCDSEDISDALNDIFHLINIVKNLHFISLDFQRFDEDVINYGFEESTFDKAGTMALIQSYHFGGLSFDERFWFLGKSVVEADISKYLRLCGDTERWFKKVRKSVDRVFRALSIQHLEMHGKSFDEDYLTEKAFDNSLRYTVSILNNVVKGKDVSIDELEKMYSKILDTKIDKVIQLV
ncbi:hypothetical protein [Vibrio fortis]|uniref:hypothetical protein n=1 Tax=Vibrio fortis TaxID=212667 RepID=UPI0021C420A1|nr:hypothetical protein [Vibrio fortis]